MNAVDQSSPTATGESRLNVPARVTIFEVGPRDGLQMEARFVPTPLKVRMIDDLSATGIARIQVTSFVRPDAIPQLADCAAVMEQITRVHGVTYSALVPNVRGAERALASAADALDIVVSVSNTHSLENTRMTTARAVDQARMIGSIGRDAGVPVCFGIATALGCPFEGPTPYRNLEAVVAIAAEEIGADLVTIADTASMAGPQDVYAVMARLRHRFPGIRFSVHLHNARGFGLANALAALQAGTDILDSSVAGLGGCPYTPGAAGNIATEDTVRMLHSMGIETGVNLDSLTKVAQDVAAEVGHLSSALLTSLTADHSGDKRQGEQ
jgi:hydroxymethylglutaryl-CoA lyase